MIIPINPKDPEAKRPRWMGTNMWELEDEKPALIVNTGLPALDAALLGGLYEGRMLTLGGPIKSAKTSFAASVAIRAGMKGIPVVIAGLDMPGFAYRKMIRPS